MPQKVKMTLDRIATRLEDRSQKFSESSARMVEEMDFNWPETLPGGRIRAGLVETAAAFLLFVGLVALGS
jgi:hypothetical protein